MTRARICGIVRLAGATALLACTAGILPAQAPRAFDLVLKPHMAGGQMDYVDVRMTMRNVDVKAGAPLIDMQMVEAGVASARYETATLSVSDAQGAVQLNEATDPPDKANNRFFRHWTANRAVKGDLVVAYRGTPRILPPGDFAQGPVMDMRAEDGGMNGRAGYFLVLPDGKDTYRVGVHWDLSGMPAGSRGIWTHGEGDAQKDLNLDAFADTIFMAGPVKNYPEKPDGRFAMYWLTPPNWGVPALAPKLQKIYTYYGDLFQDSEHSMRIFMRRGTADGGSGAGGSFLMFTPSADMNLPVPTDSALIAFLSHEMFHQFPEEFDDPEKNQSAYWWSEGMATFYSNLLVYRLGYKTLDEYLADYSNFLRNYYTDPNRLASYQQITDGMFGQGGLNLMYAKGHALMMLWNAHIKEKSGGKRSLDDVTFPLVRQHRRGGSYQPEDFFKALDRELGPQGRADYAEFLVGGKLLDLPPDLMGPCFRREATDYHAFELGFDQRAATRGETRVIKGLVAGSAAARAGVHEGDEIIGAINLGEVRRNPDTMLTLELRRDGKPVTVSYQPVRMADGFKWVRDSSVPESQCGLGRLGDQ